MHARFRGVHGIDSGRFVALCGIVRRQQYVRKLHKSRACALCCYGKYAEKQFCRAFQRVRQVADHRKSRQIYQHFGYFGGVLWLRIASCGNLLHYATKHVGQRQGGFSWLRKVAIGRQFDHFYQSVELRSDVPRVQVARIGRFAPKFGGKKR